MTPPMNPRTRNITVANLGGSWPCCICGKKRSKRKMARPAPLYLILRLLYLFDKELEEPARVGGDLCLACAKRISSRLDSVIDQVESQYPRRIA